MHAFFGAMWLSRLERHAHAISGTLRTVRYVNSITDYMYYVDTWRPWLASLFATRPWVKGR